MNSKVLIFLAAVVPLSQLLAPGGALAGDWQMLSPSLSFQPATTVDNLSVFVGTAGYGVLWSVNGGESWFAQNIGLDHIDSQYINSIAVSPSCETDSVVFITTKAGVYKSTDLGGTWVEANEGFWSYRPSVREAGEIALSPNFGSDGVAFVEWMGDLVTSELYRTADKGEMWEPVGSIFNIRALAVSPDYANDRTVFVASDRMQRSRDGGDTWQVLSNGPRSPWTVAVSPNYVVDRTLFAWGFNAEGSKGVFRSTDGGESWEMFPVDFLASSASGGLVVSPDYAVDHSVFAATRHGPMMSSDGGQSWIPIIDGIGYQQIYRLVLLPGSPWKLLALTPMGLYVLASNGQSWERLGDSLAEFAPTVGAWGACAPSLGLGAKVAPILPGGTASFLASLHNGLPGAHTILLRASSDWPTTIRDLYDQTDIDRIGPVPPGETVYFLVKVDAPETAVGGMRNITTISAVALDDPSIQSAGRLVTAIPSVEALIDTNRLRFYSAVPHSPVLATLRASDGEPKGSGRGHHSFPLNSYADIEILDKDGRPAAIKPFDQLELHLRDSEMLLPIPLLSTYDDRQSGYIAGQAPPGSTLSIAFCLGACDLQVSGRETVEVDGTGTFRLKYPEYQYSYDTYEVQYNSPVGLRAKVAHVPFEWLPDPSRDCVINKQDASAFSHRWEEETGELGYSSRFDAEQDGRISIRDLQLVAAAQGTTCSSCQPITPPTRFDLSVRRVEFTQATQRTDNGVPLIAGRYTVARVYVDLNSTSGDELFGVMAHLHARRDGIELASSPLRPSNEPGLASVSPQPADLETTLNFALPTEWLTGTLELWVELDPFNELRETNEGNNRYPADPGTYATIAFETTPDLEIVIVPVVWAFDGVTYVYSDMDSLLEYARATYPVPNVVSSVHPPLVRSRPPDNYEEQAQLLGDVLALQVSEDPNIPEYRKYVGVLPESDIPGIFPGLGYVNGTASLNLPSGRVIAHEVGHNFGRLHPWDDPDYPYAGYQIGQLGFDRRVPRAIPIDWMDFMSYSGPNFWVSDYTYEGIMERLVAGMTPRVAPALRPALLVSGKIDESGHGYLDPAFELPQSITGEEGMGAYRIELLDARGNLLFMRRFDPLRIDHLPAPMAAFAFWVPAPSGVAEVRLHKGDILLDRLQSTGAPPRLEYVRLRQSEARDGKWELNWSERQPPRARAYMVRYSPDGGITWLTLVPSSQSTRYAFDPCYLPKGPIPLLQVLASDGINTSSTETVVFPTCPETLLSPSSHQPDVADPHQVSQIQAPVISVSPPSVTLAPGEGSTIAITVERAHDVGAFEFTLAYDPQVVEVNGVVQGGFLEGTAREIIVPRQAPTIDHKEGLLTYGMFSLGQNPGASGNGALAQVELRAKEPGETVLRLAHAEVVDIMAHVQEVTVRHGGVTVLSPTPSPTSTPTATPTATLTATSVPTVTPTSTPTATPTLVSHGVYLPLVLREYR